MTPKWTPPAGDSDPATVSRALRVRVLSLLANPTTPPFWLGVIVAVSFIALEAVLVYLLERLAPENTFGAIFLLGVLVVSALWGFGLAVATSLTSALVYVFFHLETHGSLYPTKIQDWAAIVIFLPVALLANVLGAQARLRRAEAMQRRREAEASRDELALLAEQQASLRRVATLVARGVSPSDIFAVVADEVAHCVHAGNASINCFEGDEVVVVALSHIDPAIENKPVVGERHTLEGDNIATRVRDTRSPARLDAADVQRAGGSIAERLRAMGFSSTVAVPIMIDARVWGMAAVGSTTPEPLPRDTEARIGDFADLVATAIANAATRAELVASRARIVTAGDEARRRLERDLHDGAQQRLVSLGLELRLAEESVSPERDDLKQRLSHVVSGLTGVAEDLQEFSRGIHPAILSKGGLGSAIRTLARRSAVPVTHDITVDRRLTESAEVAAYYVVSEALTNAAKHAQASEVQVSATVEDGHLCLVIRDDGVGGANFGGGSGLIGLMDRVEALGGRLEVTSQVGNGTSLRATIPIDTP